MKIVKRPSSTEAVVEKTYSGEDLQKLEEQILQAKCKEVTIPGFRPGNAPLDKIREILISENKWEELMGRKLQEAVIADWSAKDNSELGDIVKIIDFKAVNKEPLTLECHFEFFPRLKEADITEKYKELKINTKQKTHDIKVTDQELNEGISELQKRRTLLKPVTDALEKDKCAFIKLTDANEDISKKSGDASDEKANKDLFWWGKEQFGKEFDEKTLNMKEGEEKIIELKNERKEDWEKIKNFVSGGKNLPEVQRVKLKIKVEKVFAAEVPELNNDFAKSLGKFNNMDDLKNSIRHGMTLEKLYQELNTRREALIGALIEKIDIEIPDSIVKQSAASYKREFEAKVGKIEKTHGHPQKSEKDAQNIARLEQVFEQKAQRELKLQRILEAIALKEKSIPDEEEVEKEIQKILQSFSKPKEARDTLGSPESLRSRVTLSLCFEKTLRFLEKENKLTEDIEKEIARIEKEEHNH